MMADIGTLFGGALVTHLDCELQGDFATLMDNAAGSLSK